MKEIIQNLEALGFTNYESRVFCVLFEGNLLTASEIAKKAEIARSSAYDILKSFSSGISTQDLVGLQRTGSYTSTTMSPWILSPSSFYYMSTQSQYNFNSLYSNDVEGFVANRLNIGILDM